MGKAGTFPAGRSPAGLGDPVVSGGPLTPTASPASGRTQNYGAPMYDLGTRQILQNANGTMPTLHPVDLRVRLALGIKLGSIPSAPGVGSLVSAARQTVNAPATLMADMMAVLKPMISAGDIGSVSLRVDMSRPGRTLRYCSYTNLRLPVAAGVTLGPY